MKIYFSQQIENMMKKFRHLAGKFILDSSLNAVWIPALIIIWNLSSIAI